MQQIELSEFPDVVRIEPAGRCNFKCIHCPTGGQARNRRQLKKDEFLLIVDQFIEKQFVPRVVVLYHGGEPLLNKNVPDYVSILKEIGVAKVQIVTNGSLLSEFLSRKLIEAGLDEIHISFDGVSADENDIIRRNGDFHRDAVNVKNFYRLYKKIGYKKVRILISNVQILFDRNDPVEIPDYLTEYFSGECPEIEFQALPAMVWPGFLAPGKLNVVSLPAQEPRYCESLFETLTILSNGDVVPCCYDLEGVVVFGNVFKDNVFDIWANQKFKVFRAKFKKHSYSQLCSNCNKITPRYLCKN